jgi:hypothetical protein
MRNVVNFDNRHLSGIVRGVDFKYRISWTDDESFPTDLTGFVVTMKLRETSERPVVAEFSTANSRIQLFPSTGVLLINVPASVTANIPYGIYRYNIIVTKPDTSKFELLRGDIFVDESMT